MMNGARDGKNRRDPAAHQIPLAVTCQFVTQDEASIYLELGNEWSSAVACHNFDAADRIVESQTGVGRFHPYFTHDLGQGLIPIYPTTPDDVGHVVELFRAVNNFLS
jgi:hypothetical protein